MWIFTDIGFFSIVQKDGDNTLTIRARRREDLEKLRDKLSAYTAESFDIIDTPKGDYPCRAILDVEDVGIMMTMLIEDIDYANFKDHVKKTAPEYLTLLMSVWHQCVEKLEGIAEWSARQGYTRRQG